MILFYDFYLSSSSVLFVLIFVGLIRFSLFRCFCSAGWKLHISSPREVSRAHLNGQETRCHSALCPPRQCRTLERANTSSCRDPITPNFLAHLCRFPSPAVITRPRRTPVPPSVRACAGVPQIDASVKFGPQHGTFQLYRARPSCFPLSW